MVVYCSVATRLVRDDITKIKRYSVIDFQKPTLDDDQKCMNSHRAALELTQSTGSDINGQKLDIEDDEVCMNGYHAAMTFMQSSGGDSQK